MNDNKYGDLFISGIGNSGGGTFHNARIDGTGTVNGDIICNNFSGNGITKFLGNIDAESARIDGISRISGTFRAKELRVNGKIRIDGSARGDDVRIDGLVRIGQNCEAERLVINGGVKVAGLMNAETIEISLHGPCKAKTIGCGKLRVSKREWGFFSQLLSTFLPFLVTGLTVEVIEGDEIRLEFTKADIVRGQDVWIGPGCEINKLEYSGSCSIDPSAKVKEQTRV